MKRLFVIAIFLLGAFSLFGCGSGGGGGSSLPVSEGNNDTGGANPPPPGVTVGPPATIALSSSLPAGSLLSQGGEITVTAVVRDENGLAVANGTVVTFAASQGAITTTATTVSGTATATYQAGTSGGVVTLTATSGVASSQISIQVATGQAASIVVESVSGHIGVKGGGITEIAALVFNVRDSNNNPVPDGTQITFSLGTPFGGGERLSAATGTTSGGTVSVSLQSGTISGVATVTASVALAGSPVISTEARVTIVAGLPEVKHFSIAPEFLNVAGYRTFGLEVPVTAYLGDRYSNPVPGGTPVSFFSEGGLITVKSGEAPTNLTQTDNGQASAVVITAAPLPSTISTLTGTPGGSTILAVTVGQEAFTDANGNGVFDSGEPFEDMGEPYIDANDNGSHDAGEFYIDNNMNGVYDGPSGQWDGNTVIWATTRILFSGQTAPPVLAPSSFAIADGGSQAFSLFVADVNGNPLVGGSSFSVSASGGQLMGVTAADIPDAVFPGLGVTDFSFVLVDDNPGDTDPPEMVELTVEITSDNNNVTLRVLGTID